ncbi:MAG: nucleotidyltransferase family protein [Candidatus Aminicenantes bacterium]|nr:nucleotidyltransferase family protein [Candidatus Aminicenantes bacterium]
MIEKRAGVWAVVLAAGESRRMGGPKLLLPYRGRTVIEAVLENAAASRVEGSLVVLGAWAESVEERIARFPALRTTNPDPAAGMLSSVQCGLRALPAEARAAAVLLGDQPWVGPETIDRVVGAFLEGPAGLVCPVFEGRGGHPLVLDLKYREEVLRLDPKEGLRRLLRLHPEDIFRLEVDRPEILEDLDRPEDKGKLDRL